MARVFALLAGMVLSTATVPAQPVLLSGPVEGFTFDAPTRSFRAVIGMVGSASLGPALADGLEGADYGSVAPHENYAIAYQKGQCMLLSGLGTAHVSLSVLAGATRRPEAVVWSGDGSVALLYSAKSNWIQPLAGFPHNAQSGAFMDVSTLGGYLSAVAIDLHGRHVAIGIGGEAGGVYLMADGQGFVPLLPKAKPIALAFSDDGSKLYAIDAAAGRLWAVHLGDLTSEAVSLHGLEQPFVVSTGRNASNREVVYVASRSDRLLRTFDASTHRVLANVSLAFQPNGMESFGYDSFLLASRAKDGDPLWFFRASPRPAVYFVPDARYYAGEGRK